MATKFEEALWRFRCDLIKEYGEDQPLAEIRVSRKLYEQVIEGMFSDPVRRFGWGIADLAEPELFGIKFLPEKR